jgi:hypothetical protein
MDLAKEYAKLLTQPLPSDGRDDKPFALAALKYKRAIDIIKRVGWSGWPPPLIVALSGVDSLIELFEESAREGFDVEGGEISVIRQADEVSYAAQKVVEHRAATAQAAERERNRNSGIEAKKQKKMNDFRERWAILRGDDPHGPKGPIIDRICKEQRISPRAAATYLSGIEEEF